MSTLSTHVLDTSLGRPAEGVPVQLEVSAAADRWQSVGGGVTNADGRVRDFGPKGANLANGTYRLIFDTASYFSKGGRKAFYPEVSIVFELQNPNEHYHVPLLLSPFGYSTYRGS